MYKEPMNTNIVAAIENHDIDFLRQYKLTPQNSEDDIFACIEALKNSPSANKIPALLKKHDEYLMEKRSGKILDCFIYGDEARSRNQYILQLTLAKNNPPKSNFVLGKMDYYLARFCAQDRLYTLSSAFHLQASKHFQKINLQYPTHICFFNIYLAQFFLGEHKKLISLDDLKEKLEPLRPNAKAQLFFLYSIIYFYRMELTEAQKILKYAIKVSNNPLDKKNWHDYLAYIDHRLRPQQEPTQYVENNYFLNQLTIIKELKTLSLLKTQSLMRHWKKNCNSLKIVMLADLLFQTHLRLGAYNELRILIEWANKHVLTRNPILPVRDLRFYSAILEGHTSKTYLSYKQHIAIIHANKLKNELSIWSQKTSKETTIILDEKSQIINLNGTLLDLSKKRKFFDLLTFLAKQKEPQSFSEIFFHLNRQRYDEAKNGKTLESLIFRCRQFIDKDLIIRKNKKLLLNPSYFVKILSMTPSKKKKEERLNYILHKLSQAKSPLSISKIQEETGINRRTLQNDLKELNQAQKISMKGSGRNTTYQLTK